MHSEPLQYIEERQRGKTVGRDDSAGTGISGYMLLVLLAVAADASSSFAV